MFPSYREKEKNEAAATRALAKWRDLPAKVLLPHRMHLLRLLEVFYRISVCIHAKGIPQQLIHPTQERRPFPERRPIPVDHSSESCLPRFNRSVAFSPG
jgi:hypothetical protein